MAIENSVQIENIENPYINKVKIKDISEVSEDLHCGTGLFYEFDIESFEDILSYMTKKHQTIAQYGFSNEELVEIIYKNMPEGIDRIVPIGKSLDFSYIWDGYDLFRNFCREIEII
jgi:hypothetical protein